MSEFTHLHVHTQFSILDGAADIKKLVAKTKEYGMNALAITDHGNMYGVLDFIDACKNAKIKPIIGCEVYVAEESRFDKKGKEDRSGFHLILLAKNLKGYNNLSKLCTLSFKEGFYYTPRVDKELLKKYKEGLIALSACLAGEVADTILNKGEEKAEIVVKEYREIFGDDFYLEIHDHGLPEQKTVREATKRISEKLSIKFVATNDLHFINAGDAEAHDILICLNTNKDYDDPNRMKYTGQEYLKSPEEMTELFKEYPEAVETTAEIANKIESYNLYHDVILPKFPLPTEFSSEDDYLKHLSYEGAKRRFGEISETIKQRLDFELSVITNMKFAGYLLIVQDFINEARKMGVSVGPGRGSAAGSEVAYCTGITDIDPIKYNLLFERFLNPERISMPDIDIDFDDDGRNKVIEYVINKYGEEKVAQIVTFGTMAAKSSIRDVARILKLPLPEANRLAKLVPLGPGVTLKSAFKDVKELADEKNSKNPLIKKTLIFAEALEGSVRQTGTHACGIIIGPDDLMEHIPLCKQKDSELLVTQYEGHLVEMVGMLKMDFLGLKTLSIIKDAIESIYERHKTKIDFEEIDVTDVKTFELFQKGETIGIFQFESDGMREHLKNLKPSNIEDLIAMNSLYRPGPMQFIPLYISRKNGKEKTEYPHPWLEDVLKPTYGIMVYQEQIMQTAQIMAGFSLAEADLLRRAMGKKKMSIMEQQKKIFIERAVANSVDEKKAGEVFDMMQEFAKYGFNRSHSAAYAILAYQTAYLKTNYPAEYMAAILTRNLNNLDEITLYMDESKKMGIPVLGPDVNESSLKFTVNKKGEIRFGLGGIKGIGGNAVESIIQEREENGNYKNIFDFVERVSLRTCNKKCIEALVLSGAFDSFGNIHRAQYFHQESTNDTIFIEKLISFGADYQNNKDSSQQSLFGETDESMVAEPKVPECEPWSNIEQLKKEKEVTGIYISGHPLDNFQIEINNFCTLTLDELSNNTDAYRNKEFTVAGIVTSVLHKTGKTGNPFGTFVLEDYSGSHQFALFSKDYVQFKKYLEKNWFLFIKGKVEPRYNSPDIFEPRIHSIELLSEIKDKYIRSITLQMELTEINEKSILKINDIIKKYPGKSKLKFAIIDKTDKLAVELFSKKYFIEPSNDFFSDVSSTLQVNCKLN
ncbi:MAG: DNA polymerase III subunit alpha [Bacteroidales bacterium]|nr:DNA polymerase III subunit alpha [Bacteroidales bacterium]